MLFPPSVRGILPPHIDGGFVWLGGTVSEHTDGLAQRNAAHLCFAERDIHRGTRAVNVPKIILNSVSFYPEHRFKVGAYELYLKN